MKIEIYLIAGGVIALLGTMIGGAMVVTQNRETPTQRPQRVAPAPDAQRPSRKSLFLPMCGVLGVSIFLLVVGYGMANIVAAAVGFLLLFLGFGLLGAFLFNSLF